MTGTVPADIVALLPQYVDSDLDDLDNSDWNEGVTVHDVEWADNLQGCCRDCQRLFDPDDVHLPAQVRAKVEAAAQAAGLIGAARAVTS